MDQYHHGSYTVSVGETVGVAAQAAKHEAVGVTESVEVLLHMKIAEIKVIYLYENTSGVNNDLKLSSVLTEVLTWCLLVRGRDYTSGTL